VTPPADPKTVFVILGNQLFPFAHVRPHRGGRFFMAEDLGLCTYVRHHKQKLVLFLAGMRSYRDELLRQGCVVHYERLDTSGGAPADASYEDKLRAYLAGRDIERLCLWEVEDKFFEERLRAFCADEGLALTFLPSPMFLTPRDVSGAWLTEHRPFMASFYAWQRRRLGILLDDDGKPVGGRWSFDDENRERLPAEVPVPETPGAGLSEHVEALIPFVNERFADHPGALSPDTWWLPTTRQQALGWLRRFLTERFEAFGPYEDALSTRGPILFHSALTPALNLGLITPREVVDRALAHARKHGTRRNSLEGFVRQVIGWREFIRAIYRRFSTTQDTRNHWGHRRRLTDAWYEGTTGIVPLDDVIRKAQRLGYAHHIERLMVAGNLMLLCEIEPREAHRWFMEMFTDSSDWVMGPNVYGMALYSDGGIFATKPYICGSNYLLKMSDYTKPRKGSGGVLKGSDATWCDVVDGLYWRFVANQRDVLGRNPRLARMVGTLDRMRAERRERILRAAEAFLAQATR
jgi:deoxyribodipyrimidine photolyase-related protein